MDRKDFIKATALSIGTLSVISTVTSCNEEKPAKKDVIKKLGAIPLPPSVTKVFASRSHRLHHALWHGLRDNWKNDRQLSDSARAQITRLNWNPPRPALTWNRDGSLPLTTNGSGEDFLFMHRNMIAEFDREMKRAGENPDIGWKLIPEPGRPESTHPGIAVPPVWELPEALKWLERRFSVVKSDEFYWSRMRWWDRKFHDHSYLRTLTLGQLGSLLETSVHNDMHMRWAGQPHDPQTGQPLVLGREDEDIDKKWDNPKYDFLGETYSSHVNPVFWRLHKWVDTIIDEWLIAHNSFVDKSVQQKTINGVSWFQRGKWVEVDEPWAAPRSHDYQNIEMMEKVFGILYPKQGLLKAKEEETQAPLSWF